MSGFLLDTNIPSELTRRQSGPQGERWLEEANDEELYFSVISLGEILKGITVSAGEQTPRRFTRVARWHATSLV
jgi:predicted nucleic acid-binding protein